LLGIYGLLINPFWMPIFYIMSVQIGEEKNLDILNKTIVELEMKLSAAEANTEPFF
jgi:hypothetical protein